MIQMDPYATLELPRNASPQEIAQAYRRLLRLYHPDVFKGDQRWASAMTQALNEAYAVLRDPQRKSRYDTTGSIGEPQPKVVRPEPVFSPEELERRRRDSHKWNALGTRLGRGETFSVNGRAYGKRDCFLKAIELFPDNSNAWMNLGDTLNSGETIAVNGRLYVVNNCSLEALDIC